MSTSTERMRDLRQRRKSGLILMTIECDEDLLLRVLIEAALLEPSMADDRETIQRAVQKLIEVIALEKL
jgi:hypothetical protein